MSDVKCARVLVEAAERDVELLRAVRRSGEVSDEAFGFHEQQGAEKALKAWTAVLGEMYPLTHDLGELFDLLAALGADVQAYGELVAYTPYAVEFRYTSVPQGTAPIDREHALGLVEQLIERVRHELAVVAGS